MMRLSFVSANSAYYRDDNGQWCEVQHARPFKRRPDGVLTLDRSRPDTYSVTLWQDGRGIIGYALYSPSRRHGKRLSERLVTRLAREAADNGPRRKDQR